MSNPENKPAKTPGVSSLWRTAMVCMLAGSAMHWWIASKPTENKDQELTVRGDPLPPDSDYDPRLDQVLNAVDLDGVPFPDALNAIAKQAGITLVITRSTLNPTGAAEPSPQPNVTMHMKYVKAGDALNSAYIFIHDLYDEPFDVRSDWSEGNGVMYTTWKRFEPKRFYTRIYDVKKLLDRRDRTSPATTQESEFDGVQYYQEGRANWLESIIEQQTSVSARFNARTGESRATFFDNSFIITATVVEHRQIERILRELDRE